MNFPDLSPVEYIRDKLWSHKPHGRASVMVGSGFSLNAKPVSASARPMPKWNDLVNALCDRLYPPTQAELNREAKASASGTSGFLRLAQEFEAMFGRTQLHETIRGLVPDNEYEPDELHRRLLKLNWADVFTTNWDTLLERTCPDIFDRSYDIIRTISEIPVSGKPRIVKLHGSFPAYEPFIFTEEDYRTYPHRFAPYVNMVQQSMMETVLCLIGFSGDDPNFLHWSGWVRDNLGPSAPKIYLVGWLNLSSQRRKMLEGRNVVPIDIAQLPAAKDWPEQFRHRYAMEWFISALEAGQPYDVTHWPYPDTPPTPPPSYLGEIPRQTAGHPVSESRQGNIGNSAEDKATHVKQLSHAWSQNRQVYPGWLVTPIGPRNSLWYSTLPWFPHIRGALPALTAFERLNILYELMWRLDRMLLPLFDEWVEPCTIALQAIDCHTRTIQDDPKNIPEKIDWNHIRAAWAFIAFGLLAHARREGKRAEFDLWLERLNRFANPGNAVEQRLHYESALFDFHTLDYEKLDATLKGWKPSDADPAWGIRKAGILSQISQEQEAISLFKNSLAKIRKTRRRDIDDIANLSREAWALWFVEAFSMGLREDEDLKAEKEPFDRWRELSIHKCDAHQEYWLLRSKLDESKKRSEGTSERKEFDLGYRRTVRHFRNGPDEYFISAHQMLMLAEATGLPASTNHVSILVSGLDKAVLYLGDSTPHLMALYALRLSIGAGSDWLDTFFTRSRIALLSNDVVNNLQPTILQFINYAKEKAEKDHDRQQRFWADMLKSAMEVYSRLLLRLEPPLVNDALSLAINCYKTPLFQRSHHLNKPLSNLFSRAIESLPLIELKSRTIELFDLPLPFEVDMQIFKQWWPEPAGNLLPNKLHLTQDDRSLNPEAWTRIIDRMISAAGQAPGKLKYRALWRLIKLNEWGLLKPDEQNRLANELWKPDLLDAQGFPQDHELKDWAVLLLPAPDTQAAGEAFKRRYLGEKRHQPSSVSLDMIGHALELTRKHNIQFSLNQNDFLVLKQIIAEWYHQPLPVDRSTDPLFPDRDEERYQWRQSCAGIARIILFSELGGSILEALYGKYLELSGNLRPYLTPYLLAPGLAKAFPDRRGAIMQSLRRGLAADQEGIASEAAITLAEWVLWSKYPDTDVPPPDAELIREIGHAVSARRKSVIIAALDVARWLFTDGPENLRSVIAAECDHGLACLLEEARYTTGQNNWGDVDIPLLRSRAVGLAIAMAKTGVYSSPAVSAWIEMAKSDPLPEVRNADTES